MFPIFFSIPREDATSRAETVVSYFPPMGDNRALTWRIIFKDLVYLSKYVGPLQSGQFDKIIFLQIILIIWIGLLVQSGWSSAICFANGPDIFEILMTTAIQV